MNTQQIIELGASAFKSQLGSSGASLPLDRIAPALLALLSSGGKFDLPGLVARMQSGGLAQLASSWLGDGGNSSIDASQILKLFGNQELSGFAAKLGLEQDKAVDGLSAALPAMVDQASSGGSLLAGLGGAKGLAGAVGKLFSS